MIDIKIYRTEHGVEPFSEYLSKMRDKTAKVQMVKAIRKMEKGLPGDTKSLGGGLREYRIHIGKGHRIYYYNDGQELVVILGGSDKKDQDKEIENAKLYLRDYKRQKAIKKEKKS